MSHDLGIASTSSRELGWAWLSSVRSPRFYDGSKVGGVMVMSITLYERMHHGAFGDKKVLSSA